MRAGAVVSWIARAGVAVLAVVGVLALVVFFVLKSLLRGPGPGELAQQEEARPAVAAVEPVAALPEGDACRCNAGAWCEGPRGGIYCMTDDGGKRYKAKK